MDKDKNYFCLSLLSLRLLSLLPPLDFYLTLSFRSNLLFFVRKKERKKKIMIIILSFLSLAVSKTFDDIVIVARTKRSELALNNSAGIFMKSLDVDFVARFCAHVVVVVVREEKKKGGGRKNKRKKKRQRKEKDFRYSTWKWKIDNRWGKTWILIPLTVFVCSNEIVLLVWCCTGCFKITFLPCLSDGRLLLFFLFLKSWSISFDVESVLHNLMQSYSEE